MTRTTTTEYTCDICGKLWTKVKEISHELPSLSNFSGEAAFFAMSSTGPEPDYCDECVDAVRVARDRVIEARKALAKHARRREARG